MTVTQLTNRFMLLYRVFYGVIRCRLLWVTLFVTERCNSRCRTCGIWRKKNPVDMPVELIGEIVDDLPRSVYFNVTGGEALLHPDIERILKILSKRKRHYTLFSNGILSEKLITTVRRVNVKNLVLSCDGPRETYKRVRGVDNYGKIVAVIEELKNEANIGIDFTMNPLNSRADLIKVKELCDTQGVHLGVGIYDNPEYFDTAMQKTHLYSAHGLATYPVCEYVRLYNVWLNGNLRLPCYSIRFSCAVLPQGDVMLCQGKKVLLGNLKKHPLSRIRQVSKHSGMFERYKNCNGCWMLCHRSYDVGLGIALKTILPKAILNRIAGEYDWDKIEIASKS